MKIVWRILYSLAIGSIAEFMIFFLMEYILNLIIYVNIILVDDISEMAFIAGFIGGFIIYPKQIRYFLHEFED